MALSPLVACLQSKTMRQGDHTADFDGAHLTQVQQLMSDVQQRHDQMRQLELSMLELHQVFVDMSILVADQGDTINSIDNWVRAKPTFDCNAIFTLATGKYLVHRDLS